MTDVDHAELKRLAEGATPGPWNNSGRSVDDFDAECMMRMEWIANGAADDDDDLNANVENDAAFIAAANPAVVLALLSEIEGLKAEVERWHSAYEIAHDQAMANGSALSALRTQAPDSWRPIDTAPKDGTELFLWCGRLKVGSWRVDEGFASKEPMWLDDSYDDFSCGFASTPIYPTHWMPLPAAPALRPQTAESGE